MSAMTKEFTKLAFSTERPEAKALQAGRLKREAIKNILLIGGGGAVGYGLASHFKPSKNARIANFLRQNPELAVGLGAGILAGGMFAKRIKDVERERRYNRARSPA